MIIKVDCREKDLINQIYTLKNNNDNFSNINIVNESLDLGDIIICDDLDNEIIIIERKSIKDLAASIKDGRYKEQSFRLNHYDKVHNHNIIYLIEGNIQKYKPTGFSRNKIDNLTIYSSVISIIYQKGFSLYKTDNLEESALWLLQITNKLMKKDTTPFYKNNSDNNNSDNNNSDNNTKNEYSNHISKTKKLNITPDNIDNILLQQIPGISFITASAIIDKYKTIKNLIENLTEENKENFYNITIKNKETDKSRKISKKVIDNLFIYLNKSV
jgi:ERCC4-type nuclease